MSYGAHPLELMMVEKSVTCFQRSSHHERTQYTESTQPTESAESAESTVTVEPEHDDHHGHDRRAGHATASRARTEELTHQAYGGSGVTTGPRKPMAMVIRRFWCVLNGGHWRVYSFGDGRVCLRCVACGHETPGWQWARR